jgi:hypothetical protein
MEKTKQDLGIIIFEEGIGGMNDEDYKTTKKQTNDAIIHAAQ